jgi:hypothetical protein
MTIRVVSKRKGGTEAEDGETVIYVGRPHVLGNPTPLGSERQRPETLRVYSAWLRAQYATPGSAVNVAVTRLAARHRAGERIALQCWCAPKRCHADYIKQLVEEI